MSALAAELAAYTAAWASLEPARLAACWDAERFRFYKAEEEPGFFTAFADLEAYWRMNDGLMTEGTVTFGAPIAIPLPGEVLAAVVPMEWRIRFAEKAGFRHSGKAMAGWNHVLTLWEGPEGGRKLTGWCEAPDAAPLYLSQLYYRAAGG